MYEALSSSPKRNRKLAAAYFCTSKASTFVAVKQVKYLLVGGVLLSEMAASKTLKDLFELVVPQPTGTQKEVVKSHLKFNEGIYEISKLVNC